MSLSSFTRGFRPQASNIAAISDDDEDVDDDDDDDDDESLVLLVQPCMSAMQKINLSVALEFLTRLTQGFMAPK